MEKENYRYFNNSEEVNRWAWQYYGSFLSDTNNSMYDIVSEYTGNGYKPINCWLRSSMGTQARKSGEIDDRFVSEAIALSDFVNSFVIPEDIVAYRFIPRRFLKQLLNGKKIQKGVMIIDEGFVSTTLLYSVARDLFWSRKENGCLLKILIPKGAHGLYVSQDDYKYNCLREYELLLPPNVKMVITNRCGIFTPKITCKVIL